MKSTIRQLLARPGYRYLLIGGSVYVFELAVILVAEAAGSGPVWAVALSYCLGTAVSFLLQKLVTFSDRRMHHKVLIPQFIATCLLVVFNFAFTLLVTKLFAHTLPAVVSRTLALLITTLWNFYLYKTRIFKSTEDLVVNA